MEEKTTYCMPINGNFEGFVAKFKVFVENNFMHGIASKCSLPKLLKSLGAF